MDQHKNVAQMGNYDAGTPAHVEDDSSSPDLSLSDLRKLIQQDIAQANNRTMSRIDGVASSIDGKINKLQSDVEEMKSTIHFG